MFFDTVRFIGENLEDDFYEIGQNLSVIYNGFPVDVKESVAGIGRDMDRYIADIVSSISTPTVNALGSLAKNIPNMVISVIMCLLSAYFFVAEKEALAQFWQRSIPVSIQDKWHIVLGSLQNAVGGYFKAQLKIELWIFLLMLVGFLLLGIPYAPLVAFLIAVLDFLPFFGAGAVMIPWAVIKFLSTDYQMAIWLLVIWGAGQLIRQIIQPKIVGDSVGIAPLPTLVLLFIGYRLAGVVGMILAVPVGLILLNMNQAGVFDTVKLSLRILAAELNHFRKFDEEDRAILKEKDK